MRLLMFITLLSALQLVGGCGQKGPLYLPETEKETEQPQLEADSQKS
jgi:predicted small lipoprotein YifL